eukprot:scaffold256361_cov31-Tisochrysis_lutea.AAC.1
MRADVGSALCVAHTITIIPYNTFEDGDTVCEAMWDEQTTQRLWLRRRQRHRPSRLWGAPRSLRHVPRRMLDYPCALA